MDLLVLAEWLKAALVSLCSLAYRLQSNGQHTLEPVRPGSSPVRTRRQSEVEKHRQNRNAKKPRAGPNCDGVSAKVVIALKANRVDPAERLQSRQAEFDRQAVERAENEGMTCSSRTGNHPAPNDYLRRGRQSGWLDARTRVIADVQKEGL